MPTAQYDLHAHTTASDGTLSPRELVRLAAAEGLRALAITDHDTVEGVSEAMEEASSLDGELEIVPGVEVSANHGSVPVHVLGLFVRHEEPWLRRFFSRAGEERVDRIHEIVKKLAKLGIEVSVDAVMARSKHGTVGRPHVAELLVDEGVVETIPEAFDRYLGQDRPAYVAYAKLSVEEACDLIHKAGGVSSLAHPVLIGNDELVPEIVKSELDALEVFHCDHSRAQSERYERMADELDLLVSGGSDFHRESSNEERQLGSLGLTRAAFEELRAHALRTRNG